MFDEYLINLYKNLNLYNNNNNNNNKIHILKNKITNMVGGAPDEYKTVFLDLFKNIKTDIESLKNNNQDINQNEIEVKLRTFKVFTDLYQYYLGLLINEHEVVSQKITDINNLVNESNINKTFELINNINNKFKTLLD